MKKLCKTPAGKVGLGLVVLAVAGAAYAWHKQHQDDHQKVQTTPTSPSPSAVTDITVHGQPVGKPVLLSELPVAAAIAPSGNSPMSWLPAELLIASVESELDRRSGTAIIRIDDPVRPQLWTM